MTRPAPQPLPIAVVGGGWAGLAAAVRLVTDGHHVTVFEASRTWGGRARSVELPWPQAPGGRITLDNGQHILIGAYTQTLDLIARVGVDPASRLLRLPLSLTDPAGQGLKLPLAPAPLDVLVGVATAKGWAWRDKAQLLWTASRWQRQGFACPATTTVSQLCAGLSHRLLAEFIEPLCVSALNTPAHRASGQVFLRVLQDAMFGAPGGSNLLLPLVPLGQLWPEPAVQWLQSHPRPATLRLGERVNHLQQDGPGWQVNHQPFAGVVWACSASRQASALVHQALRAPVSEDSAAWVNTSGALTHEAIATVYALAQPAARPAWAGPPMLALHSSPRHPAQFVFDRSRLGGPAGLLAFVVSASEGSAAELEAAVQAQAQAQLGLLVHPLHTLVEKRATFACTPALQRPPTAVAPGLVAAGDHIEGPYPATLEGAMRSGWAAGALVTTVR